MIIQPGVKINIGLFVTEKRDDGYHNISSLFYPVGLTDTITIKSAEDFSFTQSGLAVEGEIEDNIVMKAYELMKGHFALPPVSIHLDKQVPMGAGLGGGSADGSAVIKCLNEMFELYLDYEEMEVLSSMIGSDCPFFIENAPKIVTGRGEIMEETTFSLEGKYVLLVNPNLHIGTKEAYANITPKETTVDWKETLKSPVADFQKVLINDFEPYAIKKHSEIGVIKDLLLSKGAVYASMTGSGATVFGVFDQQPNTEGFEAYFTYSEILK